MKTVLGLRVMPLLRDVPRLGFAGDSLIIDPSSGDAYVLTVVPGGAWPFVYAALSPADRRQLAQARREDVPVIRPPDLAHLEAIRDAMIDALVENTFALADTDEFPPEPPPPPRKRSRKPRLRVERGEA